MVRLSSANNARLVHCYVGGAAESSDVVVFVHGFGCCAAEFSAVLGAVAQRARVVAVDRVLFVDESSASTTRDRSCDALTDELHDLLDQLGVRGKRVFLIGHSYGGLLVQHYAMRFGGVAGLVLVDPAHEDQWRELPRDFVLGFRFTPVVFALLAALSPLGLPRLMHLPFPPIHLYHPPAVRRLAHDAYTELSGTVWRRVADELDGCNRGFEQTRRLRVERPLPSSLPVTVLVATARRPSPTLFPDRVTAAFVKLNSPLAQPSSAVIRATRSNHWIHVEEPELVVDAVLQMLGSSQ
jgi:pimeloyl-ACP methyl ester carboxylesterase